MARKKRIVSGVDLIDIADKGFCIGRLQDGEIVMIQGGVPGQKVDAVLLRKKKGMWQGVIEKTVAESPWIEEARCRHFGVCGGCKWQNLRYDKQLELKASQVRNALYRIGKIKDIDGLINPIVGCEEVYNYRNKLEFSFSNKRWLTREEISSDHSIEDKNALGFHIPGSFDKILDIQECHLQGDPSDAIRNYARQVAQEMQIPFFDIRSQSGMLRNLLIRRMRSGEVMVLFSFYENREQLMEAFLDSINAEFPDLGSLLYCINPKGNDTILDLDIHCYGGRGYVIEELLGKKFRIGPKSFFQTNTRQSELLYSQALDMADITKTDVVYDLYSGIGSIGICASERCGKVVGIEVVPEAVEDARQNAVINNCENVTFLAGDVQMLLDQDFVSTYGGPDVLIVDPPRAGLAKKVVDTLLELQSPKILYISCNPSTQARDIGLLTEKYSVMAVTPVDMFPHTSHIESIAYLKLNEES